MEESDWEEKTTKMFSKSKITSQMLDVSAFEASAYEMCLEMM